MSFPAPVSLRDLCTFVFSDHSLKLNHELVLRTISGRRFQINNGNAASRKLFAQQDLIGVLTAEPVGRVVIGVPFARAINPISKTNWECTGVEPDVKVAAADALATAEKLAQENKAQK